MKNLKDIILEKLIINKNTDAVSHNKIKDPVVGETAWDYNGEAWEILDFCLLNNKQELDKLLKKYDMFGTFKDWLDEFVPNDVDDENTLAVAAQEKSSGVETVWIWGSGGICYDNKN